MAEHRPEKVTASTLAAEDAAERKVAKKSRPTIEEALLRLFVAAAREGTVEGDAAIQVLGRAALAAMAQSKAKQARVVAGRDDDISNDDYNAVVRAENETQDETCAAGAALSKAIRGVDRVDCGASEGSSVDPVLRAIDESIRAARQLYSAAAVARAVQAAIDAAGITLAPPRPSTTRNDEVF